MSSVFHVGGSGSHMVGNLGNYIIAWTLSPTPSHSKGHPPTPRGIWGNWGETIEVGWEGGVLEHKSGNNSETRKDRGNVTMESL